MGASVLTLTATTILIISTFLILLGIATPAWVRKDDGYGKVKSGLWQKCWEDVVDPRTKLKSSGCEALTSDEDYLNATRALTILGFLSALAALAACFAAYCSKKTRILKLMQLVGAVSAATWCGLALIIYGAKFEKDWSREPGKNVNYSYAVVIIGGIGCVVTAVCAGIEYARAGRALPPKSTPPEAQRWDTQERWPAHDDSVDVSLNMTPHTRSTPTPPPTLQGGYPPQGYPPSHQGSLASPSSVQGSYAYPPSHQGSMAGSVASPSSQGGYPYTSSHQGSAGGSIPPTNLYRTQSGRSLAGRVPTPQAPVDANPHGSRPPSAMRASDRPPSANQSLDGGGSQWGGSQRGSEGGYRPPGRVPTPQARSPDSAYVYDPKGRPPPGPRSPDNTSQGSYAPMGPGQRWAPPPGGTQPVYPPDPQMYRPPGGRAEYTA